MISKIGKCLIKPLHVKRPLHVEQLLFTIAPLIWKENYIRIRQQVDGALVCQWNKHGHIFWLTEILLMCCNAECMQSFSELSITQRLRPFLFPSHPHFHNILYVHVLASCLMTFQIHLTVDRKSITLRLSRIDYDVVICILWWNNAI